MARKTSANSQKDQCRWDCPYRIQMCIRDRLGPDLVQPVSEMLAATYGISGERVSQQLADVAGKLVADYWDNNGGDIHAIVDGSLLMDYDEAGVEMQFKSAAAISVTYTLLELSLIHISFLR